MGKKLLAVIEVDDSDCEDCNEFPKGCADCIADILTGDETYVKNDSFFERAAVLVVAEVKGVVEDVL